VEAGKLTALLAYVSAPVVPVVVAAAREKTALQGRPCTGWDGMRCDTMGYDGMGTMGCDTMGCDTMGCDTMGCDTMGCDTMGCDTMGCDTMGSFRTAALLLPVPVDWTVANSF
jgi:pentapeptide MXKDX repeat protein